MKKTLAILLSLALVVCMIPAASGVAFAAGETLSATLATGSETAVYTGNNITLPTLTVQYGTQTLELQGEGDTEAAGDGKYTVEWKKDSSAVTVAKDVGTYTATVSYTP